MSGLDFDLESQLQGAEPEIEAPVEVWLSGNKSPIKFTAVWKRADADEAREIRAEINQKNRELVEAQERLSEYQGYIKALEKGEKSSVEEVDYQELAVEIDVVSESLEAWTRTLIEDRLIRIKGLPLKNKKKQDVDDSQITEVLPVLFQWGYFEGLSVSLKTSMNANSKREAKRKN